MVIYVIGMKNNANRGNDGSAFIVSLAVADLLASFFVPFVIAYDFLSPRTWYLGQVMCHFLPALNPINLIASSWTLVLISVDRYRYIKKRYTLLFILKALFQLACFARVVGLCVKIFMAYEIGGNQGQATDGKAWWLKGIFKNIVILWAAASTVLAKLNCMGFVAEIFR